MGKVAAAGNSAIGRTYTWDDVQPFAQTAYYRLRQTDHDGSAHYSTVAVVTPTPLVNRS
ncbi:hypothetical protein [Hymenobacter sp. 5414T-23]|uniref:hypothetical protein n=1 Tax=Hymenobacter sp. 5414T-23 TaxID=2932252 RepID=UPI001FD02A48|nr:hypothetical protein [Hymenobacter sp. 5414T-23]UOQ82455.1 hypothetical protein MUN83_06720 [Hymenobacter sp. 5414T-23]